MTYAGGAYPTVSGQPPQRRTQYAFPASISRRRASCSLARVIMTTLSGSASANTDLSSFPRLHFSQYGFATAQTLHAPRRRVTVSRNSVWFKTFPVHLDYRFVRLSSVSRMVRTASPEAGSAPLPHSLRAPLHRRNAPLSGRALCPLPIVGRTPSQGGRNLFGLPSGFAFAARRPGQPLTPTDHRPPCKAQVDQVAHLSLSSVAARAERHPVQQQ